MKVLEFVTARDAEHALSLMASHGPAVKILAGGTDLLVDLKSAGEVVDLIIDISRAQDLKGVSLTDDGLRIGALVTHSEIIESPVIQKLAPALAEAAHSIGAVQTRNLGTLGGNLITGVPSMDSGPTLMALDARVTVAGPAGRRQMSLAELFVGPRKTKLNSDELLLEVVIPKDSLGKPAAFLKFGLRKGQALALVNVAASLWVDWAQHIFVSPRIVLGAVAPTVIRAPKAEAFLEGRAIAPGAMKEAGEIAASEARPISDFRATAEYRRELVATLTKRALEAAYTRAKTKQGERIQ